ncbi:hypothetical protein AB0B45_23165 [Nonomuraea sp. NPDC049152]|uniref:hypothetical protein n=1 Tax=Nonomuraea sp. NPDC049152 TaxID=3154350 RepID=UPI0033D6AD87
MASQHAYAPEPQHRGQHSFDENRSGSSPARPATLKAAAGLVALAALAGIGSLVVTLTGGKEMLRGLMDELVKRELGGSADAADLGQALIAAALDDAHSTLTARTSIMAFVGAMFLLFGAFVWARRNWARIAIIPFALIGLGIWLLDLTDVVPTMLHVLDGVGVAATLAALVLMWLGPSNRAIRARKEGRA